MASILETSGGERLAILPNLECCCDFAVPALSSEESFACALVSELGSAQECLLKGCKYFRSLPTTLIFQNLSSKINPGVFETRYRCIPNTDLRKHGRQCTTKSSPRRPTDPIRTQPACLSRRAATTTNLHDIPNCLTNPKSVAWNQAAV